MLLARERPPKVLLLHGSGTPPASVGENVGVWGATSDPKN